MRLKKLEVFGFKSFADKVGLEFNPGITGIVGPNGCGKSNIADAFRWVLGEQSAKSMRGNKMYDIIFAGTTTRKPLNFAEVSITLTDIQEGELPIEYAEVTVTRRIHRNGESDYFINRHPARLKDLHNLLLDSGMGKNAFSIFEQGKIDQVINYTPLERRYIFEEAAGILRFLQRKREALRKLEQSNQNICRVKDIHQEVEKQIIVLEQQAEKARFYKENKSKLEMIEKAIFVAKWDQMHKKCQETFLKDDLKRNAILETTQLLEQLEAELMEAKSSLARKEKHLNTCREEVFRRKSEKEIRTQEKLTNNERLKEAWTKEKRWQNELEEMIAKRKARQNEALETKKQQQVLECDQGRFENILKAQREKVQILETEVTKLREHQQIAQHGMMKLLQSEGQIESELKQNAIRLEGIQDRNYQLLERKEKLSELVKELIQQTTEKREQVQEATKWVDEQKETYDNLEKKLQEVTLEIQKAQQEMDHLQQEISEGKARQKALLRLREDMEGFSTGSKRLLQESANIKSPLHNKLKGLYEYLVPEKGAEMALSNVLRSYSQTLVVENEQIFQDVLIFAKKNKLKDFSLMCLASLKPYSNNIFSLLEGIVPLASCVGSNVVSEHFLKKTFIADKAETAFEWLQNGKEGDFWIRDGAYVDRNQVIFYMAQAENNIFMREAELKDLEAILQIKEENKLKLEQTLQTLQLKRTQWHAEKNEVDKILRRGEMKLLEVNFGLQRCQGDLEKSQNEFNQIDKEIHSQQRAIEDLNIATTILNERHREAKMKASQEQTLSSSLSAELEKKNSHFKNEQLELKEKESAYQKICDENRKLLHALHVAEIKDGESLQQEKRLEDEILTSKERRTEILEKTSSCDEGLEVIEQRLQEAISAFEEKEHETAKGKLFLEEVEGKLQQSRSHLKQLEQDLYQIGILLAQIESSRQSLEAELQERYHMTIEETRSLDFPLEKSIDYSEKMARGLRNELETAGDINMTSIEEFDKYKTRYEFLNQQIDDLNLSKNELVDIITQLDGESRKIFKETFNCITENFKKNFKILFNGGEADLQFTETEDVLEAGIEIIAKPPGKQMRSINLMSGGEKCLTAMALLFAIFEVKSSPFCILDEIDAPLDDSNVERFVNLVKQFIDKCQFIIITHNKRTMAIADVLFGVSMEEKGVSKLLSLEFTAAERPELSQVAF